MFVNTDFYHPKQTTRIKEGEWKTLAELNAEFESKTPLEKAALKKIASGLIRKERRKKRKQAQKKGKEGIQNPMQYKLAA